MTGSRRIELQRDIVIIGSGMAGLACARRLSAAGRAPLVLDKGRGVGGRMATRRVRVADQDVAFDHGAQYFTIRDPAFEAALAPLTAALGAWDDGAGERRFVGRPGMSSLPRAMAEGLELRQGVEATALARGPTGWEIAAGGETIRARRLVLTIPAPQAARLLGDAHPLSARLAAVAMAPCLTLMAAFPAEAPRPFRSRSLESEPLAWIAQDSAKPDRGQGLTAWVAQAAPDWSAQRLDEDPSDLVAPMLMLLAAAIGVAPQQAAHAAVHRWRYARVAAPLGRPFLRDDDGTLWLGGDWCLGARVEAAWRSGTALAEALLADVDAA